MDSTESVSVMTIVKVVSLITLAILNTVVTVGTDVAKVRDTQKLSMKS